MAFAGYNLFVTSEIEMSDSDIYNTYHNLWRIEESFRVTKAETKYINTATDRDIIRELSERW